MPIEAKREYIALLWRKYREARTRESKKLILDEICRNLGIHRKSATRLMCAKSVPTYGRGQAGRSPEYSAEARATLVRLWHRMGRMGAGKMHAALPEWLPFDKKSSREMQLEILAMSPRTIERIIRPARAFWLRKSNTGTKRSRRPETRVPIRPLGEKIMVAGHIEIDTVAHCGDSMSGLFAWTVTATDVLTGWTATKTIMGKSAAQVRAALQELESEFPFPWKAIYFDNGSEFLNETVLSEFCLPNEGRVRIPVFRSRPYRKNDQAFVEQKNWTHVRSFWGYSRIAWGPAAREMNNIAKGYWLLLQNFFVPQQKTQSKVRVGSKLKRKFDEGKTPFQRVLERPESEVSLADKARLLHEKESLEPFKLRERMAVRHRAFFRLIDASEERPMRYGT